MLRTSFETHTVAFCWSIFPQYVGMRLLPLHAASALKVSRLLTTKNVNITSKVGNCNSKIHLHHVKQVD